MATTRRVRFEKADSSRTSTIMDRAESVILGLCFAISMLVTWSSQADTKSYQHLGFSVVASGVILTAIAVTLASNKPAVKCTLTCFSAIFRSTVICLMISYQPSSIAVAVFAVSAIDSVNWLITICKFGVALFIMAQMTLPIPQKVSLGLLCLDILTLAVKTLVKWKIAPKEPSKRI